MKKTSPMAGLLLYLFYNSGVKLAVLFTQGIVWGIIFLITGNVWVHMIFGFNAIAGASFMLLAGMGNKEINWERFQLSMPVKRRDMAASQYLSVVIASLVGVPVFVVINGLYVLFNEGVYFTFMTLVAGAAPFLAIPFILAGFVFPLACLKSFENKQDALFPLFLIISTAIPQLVIVGVDRLGGPVNIAILVTLAVAVVIFIVSYGITKRLYAKIDF